MSVRFFPQVDEFDHLTLLFQQNGYWIAFQVGLTVTPLEGQVLIMAGQDPYIYDSRNEGKKQSEIIKESIK